MVEIKVINEFTLPEKLKFFKVSNEFLLPKKYVKEQRRLKTMAYVAEFGTEVEQVQLGITQIQLQTGTFTLSVPAYQVQLTELQKVVNSYNEITFASIYFVYEFTDGSVDKIKLADMNNIQVNYKRFSNSTIAEVNGAALNFEADDSRIIKDVISMNTNDNGQFVFQVLPAEFVAPTQGINKRFFQYEGVWYECVDVTLYITNTTSRLYLTGVIK